MMRSPRSSGLAPMTCSPLTTMPRPLAAGCCSLTMTDPMPGRGIVVFGGTMSGSALPAMLSPANVEPAAFGAFVQSLFACARMTSAVMVGTPALNSAFRAVVWAAAEETASEALHFDDARVCTASAVAAGAAGTLSSSLLAGCAAVGGQDWLAVLNVLGSSGVLPRAPGT